ncbi:MAG: TetR/AcrR family transcriptional regulator [Pseudodesulfovibrio sp.]|nr:TetR/AcrR family transcriptional regulator [Pseudodesulfovibrio sp.]
MSHDDTRSRILAAASHVFCNKGFDNTTIRDICTEADANVAAVNYHFGDKQKLYNQVLIMWMDNFTKNKDHLAGITSQSSPEEFMRAYIRAELKDLCTYDDPFKNRLRQMRMLLQEITNEDSDPEIFKCHKEFDEKILFPIVMELIGPSDEETAKHACIAATGILTHYFIMAIHDPKDGLESLEKLEFMTDFLTTFVLGGLKEIKESINA